MVLKEPAEFKYQMAFQEVNPQFKATDIGEIPKEWNVAPLNTISNVIDSLHQTPEFSELGFPMVRVADLKGGYLDFKNAVRVSEEVYKKFTMGYSPQKGDIILSRVGSYGLIAYVDTDENFCLGQNTAIINPKINSQYLFYSLQSDIVKKQIDNQVDGSTQKTLSLKNIKSLRIAIPSVPEQKKIAEILSSVNEAIASTQEVIDQTRKVKQGLLQQLLTRGIGHTRFKESAIGKIPEEWNVASIGEICEVTSGGTPDRNKPEYWNGTIPWVKTGEINYCDIKDTEEKITQEGLSNSSAKLVPPGSLLMAMYGQGVTRGRVAILGIEASINQACLAILQRKNILNRFLYYYLTREYENLRDIGNETTQKNLNATLIKQVNVPVPPLEEQEEIIKAFTCLDKTLEEAEASLEHYQVLKRGLMQDLLTGKVRVGGTP